MDIRDFALAFGMIGLVFFSGSTACSSDDTARKWPGRAHYPRACDGSAAVELDSGLLVAGDETNTLWWYTREGEPRARGDLVLPIETTGFRLNRKGRVVRELDLEGAARFEDRIYFVGSHGLNRNGKERPNRQIFFAIKEPTVSSGVFDIQLIGRPVSLLEALLALPSEGPRLKTVLANGIPPKEGGLNIEGLGAAPDGTLLLGLRAPLFDDDALVVFIDNPDGTLAGEPPKLRAKRISLGKRGVRSLDWSSDRNAWIVLAGSVGTKQNFALFEWKGGDSVPVQIKAAIEGNPEGMIVPAGGVFLLTDEGTLEKTVDGSSASCKDLLGSHREKEAAKDFAHRDPEPEGLTFSGTWIPLP